MTTQPNKELLQPNPAPRPGTRRGMLSGILNTLASRLVAVAVATVAFAPAVFATPIEILFLGNSYTFGRVDPVLSYNAANVHDLTAAFNATSSAGSNPWEPHPWGGIAGLFKKMTDEAGLNYDVSISARNAATLRGQYLDTANAAWLLRENVATQKWDVVVLQEQSDAPLPNGKGKNANLATFNAYADQFEKFIHNGAAQSYTETQLFGSLANCTATGLSATSCGLTRTTAANTNASAATKVYLTETWARPDMVFPHLNTVADATTSDGRPIVDTSGSPSGTQATLYYQTLAAMTADLHLDFYNKAGTNPKFAGVIQVGDAFQLAVNANLVQTGGFYNAAGTYTPQLPMDLWWEDYLHASKYGSYLDALVQFGTITGLDPRSLGFNEIAAHDLGISGSDAYALQQIAAATLGLPEPASLLLLLTGLGMLGFIARRRAA